MPIQKSELDKLKEKALSEVTKHEIQLNRLIAKLRARILESDKQSILQALDLNYELVGNCDIIEPLSNYLGITDEEHEKHALGKCVPVELID